jgi:hypothetical protein
MPPETTPVPALHLLEAAAVRSEANPERVRNALASGNDFSGFAFLPTGEPRGQLTNGKSLMPLHLRSDHVFCATLHVNPTAENECERTQSDEEP